MLRKKILKIFQLLPFFGGFLILAACSPGNLIPTEEITPSPTVSEIDPTPEPGLPPAAVLEAQTWLADQLGIEVQQVAVQSIEQKEWRDGCLELGKPDEGCLTVITPGWQIIFLVNGQTYEVRTDEDASVIRMVESLDATPNITPALENTQWSLVSFGLPGEESPETPVLEGTTVTLEFEENGQVVGTGGCNSFGALVEMKGDTLVFTQIVSTEIACTGEGIMKQEQKYFQALEEADTFELNNGQLEIWYNDNQGVLNFVEGTTPTTPPAEGPLSNSQWNLISFGPAGSESPLIEGSTITLNFGEDGQAGGSGGCNQYGANYQIKGNTLTFEGLTSTLRACADEAITQQEQMYFTALQSASGYEIADNQLIILYNEGQSRLTFNQAGSTQEPEEGVTIFHLQMIDPRIGWAVGGMTEGAQRILQTTDGGESWVDKTPPNALQANALQEVSGPLQNSPDTFFASGQEAWFVYPGQLGQVEETGVFVWFTRDGGENWESSKALNLAEIPMDYFIPSNMGFLDAQFGWMLAHLGAGMSHDYFAIFTTNDSGQSWQRVADPSQHADLQGCVKSGLVFTSPSDGWFSGNCPGLMPQLFFYQTTDGGLTWTPVDLPNPEGLVLAEQSGLGDLCGIPQLSNQTGLVRFLFTCFNVDLTTTHSWLGTLTDQGTWAYAALPVSNAMFNFISVQEGWLVGTESEAGQEAGREEKTLYHTLDGGQSWEVLTEKMGGDQIEFVDSHNGWIVSHTSSIDFLWRSSDGGSTWQEIEPVVSL